MADNTNLDTDDNRYIPGVCNIGKKETLKRRNDMFASFAFLVVFIIALQAWHMDRGWRFVVILPALALAVGLQQWYFKFCVNFGMRGLFNFGELGKTFTVEQREYAIKDRRRAIIIISTSVFFAVALAVVYYFV